MQKQANTFVVTMLLLQVKPQSCVGGWTEGLFLMIPWMAPF